jgi:hypothetical protein
MRITSTPATGSTVVMDGFRSKTIKAVRTVTIHGDEYRRTFTSTDTEGKTSRYRVTSITVYADGSSWAWAAQLTKAGQPYKNGMGLQMAGTERMAEFYGADILAVVTEAMHLAEAREADHEVALAADRLAASDTARTVAWDAFNERERAASTHQAAAVARIIASAVPQPDGQGGHWIAVHAPMCTGIHTISEPCSR